VCLYVPPIVARQQLCKSQLIVARQRLGKNPLIVARQRLGRNVTPVSPTETTRQFLIIVIKGEDFGLSRPCVFRLCPGR
jgi:hypothetical protein